MLKKIKLLLFKNNNTKQTVVKNVVWLSVSNFIGRIIRGLFIIFAARILGATEYGVFSYALGLAGFFTTFADIGISQILTKEISREPQKTTRYFATSFWLKISLLVFTTLLLIFVAPHFSKIESAKTLLYFVALLTIFDNLREFSNALFRAKEKMEFEAFVNVSMNIAIAIIGAVVLFFSQTAKAITISYVGSAGIGFLVALFIARVEFKKIISDFDKSLIKPIMKLSMPIVLLSLLGVFMLNVDTIMLGWFRSAKEIGYYSAGQKIIQLLYMIPAIIASAIFPVLSRIAEQKEKASFIMERAISAIYGFAIPLVIGGIILAEPIINFLYGNEYMPGVQTFRILLITILIIFPQSLLLNMIIANNKQNKMGIYVGIASAGNIIFNYLLIPKFGIAGAAMATVIVQTIYSSLTWKMVKKISPFETLINLKKIFVASAILGVIALILNIMNIPIIINIFISAIIYLIILTALKEPTITEGIEILRNRQT